MAEKSAKMEASAKADAKMGTRKPPRQMAAKACERCRRRKIKCDEFFPCGQCTRMRVVCKIEDPAEKRREQQQTAMEDRIKRLEALLIATYSNPNNHLEMNIPGLDQDLLPSLGGSPQALSSGGKLDPPRLTLQTPASPEFRPQEPAEFLSATDYPFGLSYWNSPESIAPSAPGSASDYFSNEVPPWSLSTTRAGSNENTPPGNSPLVNRTRASSMSTSDASQDEIHHSPTIHAHNRLSVDTSGSSLGIPQIAVTSWDQSHPQSRAGGFSPALSPQSMDMDPSLYYPPELSVGSWSGLSSPSIMAPSYPYDDHLSAANQSLPSHSRRSSINSLNPDYDQYNEPKRRRAASDLFPVPQQFIYPDSSHPNNIHHAHAQNPDFFFSQNINPNLHPASSSSSRPPSRQNSDPTTLHSSPPQEDIYTHTFHELISPLFPILLSYSTKPSHPPLSISPQIAQTQTLLTRAISTHILALRTSPPTTIASPTPAPVQHSQIYFQHALRSHGGGRWDSLPGIQTGMLLAIYLLISNTPSPNLYLLNANIVASCLDLGLHVGNGNGNASASGKGKWEGMGFDTLVAAYVLDRTVGVVSGKPCLLKDEDLEPAVLGKVRGCLREKVEKGVVRCVVEGGRVWDWWKGVVGSSGGGGGVAF